MLELFSELIESSLKQHWNDIVVGTYVSREILYGRDIASNAASLNCFWQGLGIPKGSKIAICVPSSLKWAELFISISCSDFIPIALPGDIKSALSAAVQSDCDILYIQAADYHFINPELFSELKFVISAEDNVILWASNTTSVKFRPMTLDWACDFKATHHDPDDLALIIYTSGTSSRVKGVMLSFKNISSCMSASYPHLPYFDNGSYLSILPFNHIFGLMYDLILPICCGMHLVILDRPPIPELIIPALKRIRPTMLMGVPIVLYKLMEEINRLGEWEALDTCKMIICGGAGVKRSFSKWMIEDKQLPFTIGYGMSECSPVICIPILDTYEMYSCGQPIECIQFRIDSTDPFSIPGEILVKGDSLFRGYYKDEALTQNVFTVDGWFKTGDIAYQSQTGNVFLCGRKDSQISVGSGKNIFVDDIEEKLRESCYIQDATVCFKEGKLIALIIPNSPLNEVEIRNHINACNRDLSGIYISEISFVDRIERTDKGTVKRSS